MLNFFLNGVLWNEKIRNRPTVEISGRGDWDILSYEAREIVLNIAASDAPAAGDRLTVSNGDLIWSGDYDMTGDVFFPKTGELKVRFLPDLSKIVNQSFNYAGNLSGLFGAVTNALAGLGMSLSADWGPDGIGVGGDDEAFNSIVVDNPMQAWLWINPADGREYLIIKGVVGGQDDVWLRIAPDGEIAEYGSALPSGSYSTTVRDYHVPFAPGLLSGTMYNKWVFYRAPDGSLRRWQITKAGNYHYGFEMLIDNISYDDATLADALKDLCLISDSYFYVLNNQVKMIRYDSAPVYILNAPLISRIERKASVIVKDVPLNGIESSTKNFLLRYYQARYAQTMSRFTIKYLGQSVPLGRQLRLNGENLGIVRSIKIDRNGITEIETDRSGSYQWT